MDNAGLSYVPNSVDTSDLTAHTNKKGNERHPDKSDSANEWYYKKQEAELNHRYEMNAASFENQLMVDQWNRENEYNDPSAVAARYRAAGINPRAAFGTGAASGAGIAAHSTVGDVGAGSASGTYGKSGLTQGIENAQSAINMIDDVAGSGVAIAKSVSDLTNTSADTTQKKVVTEGLQIDNRYKEQKILTELTKERAEISRILSDAGLKDAEKVFYEKRLVSLDQEIKESEQRIKESGQRMFESGQNIKESQSRENLNNKTAEKVVKETDIMEEQRTAMLEGLVANMYLKGAQEEYYLELATKVGKDIELISKDLDYYGINLSARLAQMTSSELRGWAGVLNEYLERRDQKESAKLSNEEKNRQNRILLLRFVLPYLLK